MSHRIHGTGIFTYIYHKNQPNVGEYASPMDPMGVSSLENSAVVPVSGFPVEETPQVQGLSRKIAKHQHQPAPNHWFIYLNISKLNVYIYINLKPVNVL